MLIEKNPALFVLLKQGSAPPPKKKKYIVQVKDNYFIAWQGIKIVSHRLRHQNS